MADWMWSFLLVAVGLAGFIATGQKFWWGWYINIACQGLWFTYGFVTGQWGFIAGAIVYTVVFIRNAYKWTKDHFIPKWIGESATVKLTGIRARTMNEAYEHFEKLAGHPAIDVWLIKDDLTKKAVE